MVHGRRAAGPEARRGGPGGSGRGHRRAAGHGATMREPMRLSIFGARGVPARWGGWDTIVTELGPRLVQAGHEVTLYAMPRYTGEEVGRTFEGMRVTRMAETEQAVPRESDPL